MLNGNVDGVEVLGMQIRVPQGVQPVSHHHPETKLLFI